MAILTNSEAPTQLEAIPDFRLRLIGQMQASADSRSLLPVGRKTRALLAMIAMAAPRPLLRSRLAEMLWSRRPEEQARASLRQEIHRLLDALGPDGAMLLSVSRDQVALAPVPVWIDLREIMAATPHEPQALALFDGELLEGLDGLDPVFDAWLASERERLRDRARGLAEVLLREQTEPDGVIDAAQRLLGIDRAHEGAWRALMAAHAVRGEAGLAIQLYDRCRQALLDLLDAGPSTETQRLVADIRAGRVTSPPPPVLAAPLEAAAHDRPCIARIGVLPFTMVGGVDTLHLGASLAAQVTASLARFRLLEPVSPAAVARLAEPMRDDATLRRMLGIDWLIEGTLHPVGARIRVGVHLLDLRSNSQLVWAQNFDHAADDLLALLDDVAVEVAAQLEAEIMQAEQRRLALRPVSDFNGIQLMLAALPRLRRMERATFLEAGVLLRNATEQAPELGQARAWLAYWRLLLLSQGWATDAAAELRAAVEDAETALQIDPHDFRSMSIAGHVRCFLQRRPREALALHEQAMAGNPGLAMAWAHAGFAKLWLGDVDEGERLLRHSKLLSPQAMMAFRQDSGFILSALLRRDFEGAVLAGRRCSELNPGFSGSCKPYLAALGWFERPAEARIVRARLLGIDPAFTVQRLIATTPLRRPEHVALLVEGLRRAGAPEG